MYIVTSTYEFVPHPSLFYPISAVICPSPLIMYGQGGDVSLVTTYIIKRNVYYQRY